MNVIVYGTSCLPTLASTTSLRYLCSAKDIKSRSIMSSSKVQQQQQLQTNGNSTTNDAPIAPSNSVQSTQDSGNSDSVDITELQNIDLNQLLSSASGSFKNSIKTKRSLREKKASRKAVRRLRLLQIRASESTSKSEQEKTLASASKILNELLTSKNEQRKRPSSTNNSSNNNQPSPDDTNEWRRAMLRLFSIFRNGSSNEFSLDYRAGHAKERFTFEHTDSRYTQKSDNSSTATQGNEDSFFNPNLSKPATSDRITRALLNAHVTEQARQSQPETSSDEKTSVGIKSVPGSANAGFISMFSFEKTEMRYPPADRYPPPIPMIRDINIEIAATAFGLNRGCDVHWVQGKSNDHSDGVEAGGAWRKIMHGPEYFVQHMHSDRMDSGQGLEYLGDSVVNLVSRSLILERFPRRSMALYNLAVSWLVSNDVFGHIYVDAGLAEERQFIADVLMQQSKQHQLEQMRPILTTEQFQLRKNAPLPALQLPVIHHLKQADLFEAYVGAVYLTFGFRKASEWCSGLFEPWLDRIARTRDFLIPKHFSQAGEVQARIEERIREELRKEYEQQYQQSKQDGIFASAGNWFRSTFGPNKGNSN
ncbi:uncharacterized protein FA14DRAFT_43843 [Meira miltonrushii]|uniref:RNase III domain-containing protein n=1 Tax=Meira miltonrushii TaxID=1280837 RepID=A0A316VJ80_9BASI|nr:uncharacterized protein FA14DRAFT_43843 [Meira miltonrushii]PWN35555.1 hypothetical protein FA14DRAFT_43843 [Meira miltonrushii]